MDNTKVQIPPRKRQKYLFYISFTYYPDNIDAGAKKLIVSGFFRIYRPKFRRTVPWMHLAPFPDVERLELPRFTKNGIHSPCDRENGYKGKNNGCPQFLNESCGLFSCHGKGESHMQFMESEMMFSAGRSRRLTMVPIIQSIAQLEKNYGKEGAEIIVDNTQVTLLGGRAQQRDGRGDV